MLMDFDFGMLRSDGLMKLDLSQNNLTFLRNVRLLEGFDSLEELSIAGNQLENIQDLIQHLKPAIMKLDLSGNAVGSVNEITFEWLTEMRSLNLSNTMLSINDFKAFEPLKNLSSLDISHNNLTLVNASHFTMFAKLNQLFKLNIAYCQLRNVSNVIQALGSTITELDVSGNSIETLHANTFNFLINLESLNLSDTNMTSIDFSAFKILTNLRILDISSNKLREINFEPITNRLNHLYLTGND